MKISILGTNGFLSTAIARYSNLQGWDMDMYGLDEPVGHKYDNFYKVNLMDTDLNYNRLLTSDIIIYAIGAGIQSNLNEDYNLIYTLNVTVPVAICNKLKELDYEGRFVTLAVYLRWVRRAMRDTSQKKIFSHLYVLHRMITLSASVC